MQLFLRVVFLMTVFVTIGVGILFFDDLKGGFKPFYFYQRGNYAYHQEDYETSQHFLQAALSERPKSVKTLLRLGDAHVALGHLKLAGASYRKALDIDPKSREAVVKLARCEWAQNHRQTAMLLYGEAVEKHPKDVALRQEMAHHFQLIAQDSTSENDLRRAEHAIEQYLERAKSDDEAHYMLAENLYAQGKYEKSLMVYCKLAQKHPKNPETLYSLGLALAKNNAYAVASRVMEKAADYAEGSLAQEATLKAYSFQRQGKYQTITHSKEIQRCIRHVESLLVDPFSTESS